MASWGRNIVIAEPAPALAHPARYLAPVFRDDDADNDPFLIPVLLVLGTGIVFITLGGGLGELAARSLGAAARVSVFIGFDVLAATVLVTAYVLIARHGLRFPTGTRATEESAQRRLLAAQGNTAWRCLPDLHRSVNTEQVRAMNAAARLLLIHPDDQEADTVLRTNSQTLHQLTLTQHEAPAPREGTSTA